MRSQITRLTLFASICAIGTFGVAGALADGESNTKGPDQQSVLSAVEPRFSAGQLDDLNRPQALHVLQEQFPALNQDFTDVSIRPEGGKIESYQGDTVARVQEASGKRHVVVSTRPLRAEQEDGSVAPVDIELTKQGKDFKPRNAPFELDLGGDAREGFALGADEASQVSVVPLGAAKSTGVETGDKLFYANTYTDTDSLLMPTIDGIETFEQLRSSEAPEEFTYRLDLPEGAFARLVNARIEVVKDNNILLQAQPPHAIDAKGEFVDTEYKLVGNLLTVTVNHRQSSDEVPKDDENPAGQGSQSSGDKEPVSYPVLLDPIWDSEYDWIEEPPHGIEG